MKMTKAEGDREPVAVTTGESYGHDDQDQTKVSDK